MYRFQAIQPRTVMDIPKAPIAKFLFSDTRIAGLWLIVRIYVGYSWLVAGGAKLTGHSFAIDSFGAPVKGGSWVFNNHGGTALRSFIATAVLQGKGPHPVVQGWYAAFLQYSVLPHVGVFTYVVAFGETLVGLGLIFGAFTGIPALFGIFMNMNYLLAGSVSINPILGMCALLLVLAWRISGFYGLDRYLIPLLGTPWTRSLLFENTFNGAVDRKADSQQNMGAVKG